MLRCLSAFLGVALAASGLSASAAEWGTLKGKIVYDGKAPAPAPIDSTKDQFCGMHKLVSENVVVGKDGGLANVVIFVRTKGVDIHPDYEKEAGNKVVLDNNKCQFVPHVVGLWNKQTLVLKNSDPTAHNSKVDAFANGAINPLIPAMGQVENKFGAPETTPAPVSCNIHPWMKAWIVVRPDPYFAITDENGEFEIKNLPAGKELEFQVWQEEAGYLKNISFGKTKTDTRGRFEMKLKAGDNDLGQAKVDPKLLKK